MWTFFTRFVDDESGATAIEYALIASGIFMTIVITVGQLGTNLNSIFQTVNTMGWSSP